MQCGSQRPYALVHNHGCAAARRFSQPELASQGNNSGTWGNCSVRAALQKAMSRSASTPIAIIPSSPLGMIMVFCFGCNHSTLPLCWNASSLLALRCLTIFCRGARPHPPVWHFISSSGWRNLPSPQLFIRAKAAPSRRDTLCMCLLIWPCLEHLETTLSGPRQVSTMHLEKRFLQSDSWKQRIADLDPVQKEDLLEARLAVVL